MAKRKNSDQIRQQIIESIDTLMYQKGFNMMSFSDIARASGVSKGNLYYYFKTKEALLKAIIEYRIDNMKTLLSDWENELDTPLLRLQRFVKIILNEADNVTRFGCPMGSLNTELGKSQIDLRNISRQQFDVFKTWLCKQFILLSDNELDNRQAEQSAMHLLVHTQGIAVMSQVYSDKSIITEETKKIEQWLMTLKSDGIAGME